MTLPETAVAAIARGESDECAGDYLTAASQYAVLAADADPAVAAEGHFHLGRVAWRQAKFDAALAEYRRAQELARRIEHGDLLARLENAVGAVHYARGHYDRARASYQTALALTDNAAQCGQFLLNLGVIANIQGDFEGALGHYARARSLLSQSGDGAREALALHNLAMLRADREEWEEADAAYARCLELFEKHRDRPMVATVLLNWSEVLCARGQLEEAVAQCDLALEMYAGIADEIGRGEALRWKGRALRLLARHAEAEDALTESVRLAAQTQGALLEAEALRELAALRRTLGDVGGASEAAARARQLFAALGAVREVESMAAELEEG